MYSVNTLSLKSRLVRYHNTKHPRPILNPNPTPRGFITFGKRRKLTTCANNKDDGTDSDGNNDRNWRKWLSQMFNYAKFYQPIRVIFNAMVFFFLLRLFPIAGQHPLFSNPALEHRRQPFSEFMKNVRNNEVESVSVDGETIHYWVRSAVQQQYVGEKEQVGGEQGRVTFMTTRPQDMQTPYEILMRNGVPFNAVEKRGNSLVSVLIFMLHMGLILAVMNRVFPLRIAEKGQARRHKQDEKSLVSVTFADVAGVDEAKEELEEVKYT
eukprot:TRINITY_DN100313_c0_g1_i1.p2 TRINITY_DN100313_c0_g1~~TRINITY_DN100313_c0_g1_i1.p2  ORF type:complete len:294 (+),score=19.68 TRINITY_DN100313_c0_g1_i1:84-884(+)